MTVRRFSFAILYLGIVLGFMFPASAESEEPTLPQFAEGKDVLRGLASFTVVVEDLSDDAVRGGLTRELLETDVELKLRTAGVRIRDYEEEQRLIGDWPGYILHYCPLASLYVRVVTAKWPDAPTYAVSIDVEVKEWATLSRDEGDVLSHVTTWDTGYVVIVGEVHFRQGVRDGVKDCVDRFLNDYLAANPRD